MPKFMMFFFLWNPEDWAPGSESAQQSGNGRPMLWDSRGAGIALGFQRGFRP
ncbi:hypothetical protein ACOALZ_00430 [Nocardiopsis algeriensis]|uniref:hypothetical protein n=1 Tax=Nocardiopsis algeriensis TaxID=1478215 RepID=UPI003B42857C